MRVFFACVLFLFPLIAESKIIETAHIVDVIPHIDQDTWFLVDLDHTLFEAKQALGHAFWFYDEVDLKMEKGISKDEAISEMYPLWVKTQQICPVQPLEEEFISSVLDLQKQGIVVMGLTHRQPPVAEASVRQVNSLGIDFTKTAPSKAAFPIPADYPALYLEGIVFVGEFNVSKGKLFMRFLSKIGQLPKKVVFIDDKRKNVEDLEKHLSTLNIEYVGIHYTAIDQAKPVFSREVAQFQQKFLDKLMSNEAALILMEKGVE